MCQNSHCPDVEDLRSSIYCLVTVVCVRVQNGWSCLYIACYNAHLEAVKYLCEVGGKELLMLKDNVSACGVRVVCACVFVSGQMMVWAGVGTLRCVCWRCVCQANVRVCVSGCDACLDWYRTPLTRYVRGCLQ
jgi:hypothetical protein